MYTHTHTHISICLLFPLLGLLPFLSSSPLSCIFFFFHVSLPKCILPPQWKNRWFKIHTYVAIARKHLFRTIFKHLLITSVSPGGRGKGKSRPYLGLQQHLKWNHKDALFSYNVRSRQKHINVVKGMNSDWPGFLGLINHELSVCFEYYCCQKVVKCPHKELNEDSRCLSASYS